MKHVNKVTETQAHRNCLYVCSNRGEKDRQDTTFVHNMQPRETCTTVSMLHDIHNEDDRIMNEGMRQDVNMLYNRVEKISRCFSWIMCWKANLNLHRDHHQWVLRLLGCTIVGYVIC